MLFLYICKVLINKKNHFFVLVFGSNFLSPRPPTHWYFPATHNLMNLHGNTRQPFFSASFRAIDIIRPFSSTPYFDRFLALAYLHGRYHLNSNFPSIFMVSGKIARGFHQIFIFPPRYRASPLRVLAVRKKKIQFFP